MAGDQKQSGVFAVWAGIIVALIGLATAAVEYEGKKVEVTAARPAGRSDGQRVDPEPQEPLPQPTLPSKPLPQYPPQQTQTQADPAPNGACNLLGDWEFVMDGRNPSDQFDLPAKFSGGLFVITGLPSEIRSDCILSKDAMTLIPPDVNFLGDQTNIIIMMMPKHYRKEGDNTYSGNTSGTNFYIRRR